MKHQDFERIMDALRQLSLFVFECMQKDNIEQQEKALNSKRLFTLPPEEVEHEKRMLKILQSMPSIEDDVAPLRNSNDALQVNTVQNCKVWTAKELNEMPFIKDMKYRITKDGLHQFRYRRDGINVQITSKNFETAKQKAREFIYDLKRKLGMETKPKHINSLDYVAQLWFRTKRSHALPTTVNAYLSVYRNHIKPKFGNLSISKILPMDLQPFFDDLHGKLGKTCENCKVLLNGFFELAVANRLCPSNPMAGVVIERHCRKPGKSLTDEQLKRFKQVMLGAGAHGTAFLIILYSGIRGAELERMTFDWEQGTFTVYNAKLKKSQRRREENLTRTVPIFPGLLELKDRIIRYDSEWRIRPRRLPDLFNLYWQENTPKDLRHTFTTKARESHIENELVNLWTGHLPGTNVTANVYTHFSEEYQKSEAKKLRPY